MVAKAPVEHNSIDSRQLQQLKLVSASVKTTRVLSSKGCRCPCGGKGCCVLSGKVFLGLPALFLFHGGKSQPRDPSWCQAVPA